MGEIGTRSFDPHDWDGEISDLERVMDKGLDEDRDWFTGRNSTAFVDIFRKAAELEEQYWKFDSTARSIARYRERGEFKKAKRRIERLEDQSMEIQSTVQEISEKIRQFSFTAFQDEERWYQRNEPYTGNYDGIASPENHTEEIHTAVGAVEHDIVEHLEVISHARIDNPFEEGWEKYAEKVDKLLHSIYYFIATLHQGYELVMDAREVKEDEDLLRPRPAIMQVLKRASLSTERGAISIDRLVSEASELAYDDMDEMEVFVQLSAIDGSPKSVSQDDLFDSLEGVYIWNSKEEHVADDDYVISEEDVRRAEDGGWTREFVIDENINIAVALDIPSNDYEDVCIDDWEDFQSLDEIREHLYMEYARESAGDKWF